MCEIEINIACTKKHMYKERKETTHVDVGEEDIHHHHHHHHHHHIYIYIYQR